MKLGEGVDLDGRARRRDRRRQRRDGHRPDRPASRRDATSPSSTGAPAPRCRPTTSRRTTPRRRASGSPSRRHRSRSSTTARGATRGLRCSRMAPGAPDASGRRRPEPIPGSEFDIDCDVIITAIGMAPDTAAFAGQVRADKAGRLVGRRADAPDRRPVAVRRRRRRDRRLRHHPGDRRGPAGRIHDRPLDPGPDPRGLRPPPPGRRQGRGPRPPEGVPTRACRRRRARSSAPPRPTSARSSCR